MSDVSAFAPPRVIATDLDGTLLHSDGSLSDRTRAAIGRAEAAGIETVFVTARPPRWLDGLADAVGAHGIALCGNGAFVYDVGARKVTDLRPFDARVVEEIAADLRRAFPAVRIAAERVDGPRFEPGFAYRREAHDPSMMACLADIVSAPIGKLLARCSDAVPADFVARVAQIVQGRAELGVSDSSGLAEMTALGVTKATGLRRWCEGRGVSADDVWAFGDMPNDLPMLHWAGTSFAVGNAHTDVLAVAQHVCPSNDDDGVAHILEILLQGASE